MMGIRTAGCFLVMAIAMTALGLSGCSNGDTGSGSGSGGSSSTASTGSTGTGAHPCVPGAQAACACLSGRQGIQVCKADGSGYDACQGCDAGTGGNGGASTTAVTGTGTTTTTGMGGSGTTTSGSGGSGAAGQTELDLHVATLYDNPPDLADWPITTTITYLEFRADGVHVEFSKRDGPGRWPDIIPPGWAGPLEYTLGMAEYINGQWYASAAIEFWYGLDASGGNIAESNQVAVNWYYDGRWGALAGRQPATGETIGIFVAAGNTRAVHTDDPLQSPVMERSNVVLVPMPDVNGAQHTFP